MVFPENEPSTSALANSMGTLSLMPTNCTKYISTLTKAADVHDEDGQAEAKLPAEAITDQSSEENAEPAAKSCCGLDIHPIGCSLSTEEGQFRSE